MQSALRGLRFESLDQAQAWLDHWDTRGANIRIHGTTKRQVVSMFVEERPLLRALPIEPFRYYSFGKRGVHLDGFVEVMAPTTHRHRAGIGRTVVTGERSGRLATCA